MPRQVDSSLLKAQVTNNPTTNISFSSLNNIIQDFVDLPEITLQAIETAINELLGYIDQVTGLNLLGLATALEGLFGSGNLLSGLLSFILGTGTTLGGQGIIPAVAFDASSYGSVSTGSPTSLTVPHTCAPPPNTGLVTYVSIVPLTPETYAGGTHVTYNSVPMASQGFINLGDGTVGWEELFTLEGPTGGTNNLTVVPPAAVQSIAAASESATGCSGFSGFVSAATDAPSQSLTVQSVANGMVSIGMACATTISGITGATQRTLQTGLIVGDAPGGPSVTATATAT